jgi:hypothetical protein
LRARPALRDQRSINQPVNHSASTSAFAREDFPVEKTQRARHAGCTLLEQARSREMISSS